MLRHIDWGNLILAVALAITVELFVVGDLTDAAFGALVVAFISSIQIARILIRSRNNRR